MQLSLPQNRVYRHLLFWAVVLLFFFSIEFAGSSIIQQESVYVKLYWINFFFESLPTYLFFTYTLLFTSVPLFLKKRYLTSILAFVCLLLLTIFLQKILSEFDLYFIQPYVFQDSQGVPFKLSSLLEDLRNPANWITLTYDFVFVGFVAAGIKIFNAWMREQRASILLEQEKLRTELQLIKTQINPDFLFDTLNNLHTLTMQQSDQSPEVVLKLAGLLSYLLYESQAEEVLLEREIEMIDSYTYLKGIHADNNLDLSKHIRGDIKNKRIAPLILLPFLEYVFKTDLHQEQEWASIDISVADSVMKLIIIKGTTTGVGIGFDNVKKRLDNLYPSRYELKIIPEEDTVLIKLILMLNTASTIQKPTHYETELFID